MPHSKHDGQRRSISEVELSLQDRAELTEPKDSPTSQEPLNLGHAALRSECWGVTSATASASYFSGSPGPREATVRLPRPGRKRTPLHRLRPSQWAEARFTSQDFEILTD